MNMLLAFLLAIAPLPHKSVWNEDQLRWEAPIVCTTGEPISQCPVSGYQISTAADNSSTVWSIVAKVDAATLYYDITNVAPGKHCYSIRTIFNNGNTLSAPLLMGCDTAVAPLLSPTPPLSAMVDGT